MARQKIRMSSDTRGGASTSFRTSCACSPLFFWLAGITVDELEERNKDTPKYSGREGSHYQEQRRQSEERGGRLRHREYPGDALFAGVFGPGAAPPTRGFVVSPVHPSLHDAYYQADGHRSRRAAATTLLDFIVRLRTEDEARRYTLRFASSWTYQMAWKRGRWEPFTMRGKPKSPPPRRDAPRRRESRRGNGGTPKTQVAWGSAPSFGRPRDSAGRSTTDGQFQFTEASMP
ncbi:hypothetical protein THAOC_19701 [Thalassiosira oceanica]|uniref:Uncharacterized protein n=1 Tax=Thalassiosira oceanica TaxID=159749 RepID=K0S1P8_THAOC|nr:hypothetical protein THAOC_19701 [Thalassiosira oceanica]|eukprot:EJK60018.1 hypothetical protein THAOC_19701 [Thalassiosira oceanica]